MKISKTPQLFGSVVAKPRSEKPRSQAKPNRTNALVTVAGEPATSATTGQTSFRPSPDVRPSGGAPSIIAKIVQSVKSWFACLAACWRGLAEQTHEHSIGYPQLTRLRNDLPTSSAFSLIFDRNAPLAARCDAANFNNMIALGTAMSYLREYPLDSQDYDALALRRLLFQKTVGTDLISSKDATKKLLKMMKVSHADKQALLPQQLKSRLRGKQLQDAVQHLKDLCDNATAFNLLVGDKII